MAWGPQTPASPPLPGRQPGPRRTASEEQGTLTRQQRVLNAQHRRSVPTGHGFHDLFFGDIGTSFFYSNTSFQVIKISSIEFKKLDKKHSKVFIGSPGIDSRMQLEKQQTPHLDSSHFLKSACSEVRYLMARQGHTRPGKDTPQRRLLTHHVLAGAPGNTRRHPRSLEALVSTQCWKERKPPIWIFYYILIL